MSDGWFLWNTDEDPMVEEELQQKSADIEQEEPGVSKEK